MANIFLYSVSTKEHIPYSKQIWQETLLPQIEKCEKKSFAASEAFDFNSELKKSNVVIYCYLDSIGLISTVVAYSAFMLPKIGNSATLHKICVDKAYRQRRIAYKLLSVIVEHLQGKQCSKLLLWVREENTPAIALYRKLGFQTSKQVEDYYGSGRTGLHMILDLASS